MRSISVSEAKAHFCSVLKEVAEREAVAITSHGRIVARIIAGEERQPPALIRPIGEGFDWRTVRADQPDRRPSRDALDVLMEDRTRR